MSHVRTQIRKAFEDRLTGLSTTGNNVYVGRPEPVTEGEDKEYPALYITVGPEVINSDTSEDRQQKAEISHIQNRKVTVIVTGLLADEKNSILEDRLDCLAAEIEEAVFEDQFLGGICMGTDLLAEDPSEYLAGTKIGVITITFQVLYMTWEGQAQTAL